MKTVFPFLLLMIGVSIGSPQGHVTFQNNLPFQTPDPTGGNRLVYEVGTSPKAVSVVTGVPLIGTQFVAELYAGTTGDSLVPVTSSISRFRATTTARPGIWTVRTLSGLPNDFLLIPVDFGSTVFLQVKVWDFDSNGGTIASSTYETASGLKGQSIVFTYQVPAEGDLVPSDYFMEGLQAFSIFAVPEPAVLALSCLGVAGLFLCRRR